MNQNDYGSHDSIMLNEITDYILRPFYSSNDKKILIADLTFGGGGHSKELIKQYENIEVLGIDQDEDAIENGTNFIIANKLESKLSLWHTNFKNFPEKFKSEGLESLDGVIMDLGVSSHQFDEADRGFSFRKDAILDMRMDKNKNEISALEMINEYPEEELANIIYKYGEERLSRRIAKNIIEARKKEKIETTSQLENIIFHSYPKSNRYGKAHPATRTFQAIRIAVNNELEVLEDTLPKIYDLLSQGSRMAILSFHSLEDRIVKHFMKSQAGTILTKKPSAPSFEEINKNKRARSAKLRVIEKS